MIRPTGNTTFVHFGWYGSSQLEFAGGKRKPAGSKKIKTAGGVKEVKFYKGKMTFSRDKADGKGTERARPWELSR